MIMLSHLVHISLYLNTCIITYYFEINWIVKMLSAQLSQYETIDTNVAKKSDLIQKSVKKIIHIEESSGK